jgi:hypothetical protein
MLEYNQSPLEVACGTGKIDVVRKIISQLDLTTKPNYWDDLLKKTAFRGKIEIVNELLKLPAADPSEAFELVFKYARGDRYNNSETEKTQRLILRLLLNDNRLNIPLKLKEKLWEQARYRL